MVKMIIHKYGFVQLIDSLGNDARIVESARVSYAANNKPTTDKDRERLIDYLMRHEHWTPFEQVELVFHIKCPIFVQRQWIRHRTANVNEVSGRYTELPNETYLPEINRLMGQDKVNKQGSGEELSEHKRCNIQQLISVNNQMCRDTYKRLLDLGLSKELARTVLPVGQYTEFYWKIDLRNLFNFLRLRLDSHAQPEIREYAIAMYNMVKDIAPMACKAFENHVLNSVKFSEEELDLIRQMISLDVSILDQADYPESKKRELYNKLSQSSLI